MTKTASPNDQLARKILVRAREIIHEPKNWTRGVMARDLKGNELDDTSSPNACTFCAYGAIERAGHEFETGGHLDIGTAETTAARHLMNVIKETHNIVFVSVFNDHPSTTHADVLAAFTLAISNMETNQ